MKWLSQDYIIRHSHESIEIIIKDSKLLLKIRRYLQKRDIHLQKKSLFKIQIFFRD